MKAVIVIEVDPTKVPEAAGHLQGGLTDEDRQRFGVGTFYAAVDDDAELILDVFAEPKLGGGKHVAKIEDSGWTLEHSLICRRTGRMIDCPVTQLVSERWEDNEGEEGYWLVTYDSARADAAFDFLKPLEPVQHDPTSTNLRSRWCQPC